MGASALRDAVARHPEWVIARHDVLCVDPVVSMRTLVAEVGLEWGEATEQYLVESDREGSGYLTHRKAEDQPDRWRARLTSEQVDACLAELARFPGDLVES